MRVAILEADTPTPGVVKEIGSYGVIFTNLLRNGGLQPEHTIETYDVVSKMEYPAFDGLDAILITGSKFTVYHNDEWILKLVDFTREAISRNIKIIGKNKV
jgi:GMP synthase-like glutamine amidotransferase